MRADSCNKWRLNAWRRLRRRRSQLTGRSTPTARRYEVQALTAARVSGSLQKYVPGEPIKAGAALLMPVPSPAPSAPGQLPPVTTGAAIVLTLENPNFPKPQAGARLPAPPPRFVGVESPAATRPGAVALGKETYAAISALAEGATVVLEAEVKPGARTQTWNAVGRLAGSDPASAAEVILLSAHLDHLGTRSAPNAAPGADTIFNGADDDASGTVAVLELAQALAAGPASEAHDCLRVLRQRGIGWVRVTVLRR